DAGLLLPIQLLLQTGNEGIEETGKDRLDQRLLRTEVIVDRCEVDAGLAGDESQGGLREPFLGEQLLCSIQNTLDCFRLCHRPLHCQNECLKHTFQTDSMSTRGFLPQSAPGAKFTTGLHSPECCIQSQPLYRKTGMDEMQKLTARQQQVLAFIREYMATNGYPPTRVDIARELGFRSPNAAEDHLKALARKGAIEVLPRASRGIRLPRDAE